MPLIEPLEAHSQRVNTDVGPAERSVIDQERPIKARGRVHTSTGRPKREAEAVTEDEVLETRGRFGSKAERAIGFPLGGSTADSSDSGGSTGRRRDAEPIKFSSCGGNRQDTDPDTGGVAVSNEALTERGKLVLWDPTDDLVERERGSRWGGSKRGLVRHPGGYPKRHLTSGRDDSDRREAEPARWGGTSRREAEPIKFSTGSGCRRDDLIEGDPGLIRHPGGSPKRGLTPSSSDSYRREAEPIRISGSRGGHRREAEPIAQSMMNPGGGPKRRDAAAQPGRPDIGKGHDRRDANAETIEARQRMSSDTGRGRRDAIRGFVRPGGGTRPRDAIPRDLRGDDANPRGVRPGNGNNERDVTAETVEARWRFRGNSRLV